MAAISWAGLEESKENSDSNIKDKAIKLKYDVVEWSSYSPGYHPRLITVNKPDDLSSRWLSESGRPPQYVILELSRPAIVTCISFGKFNRPHACNVHKLKILGGMDKDTLVTLNDGELRNDGHTESLYLRHKLKKKGYFPCLYIKIILLDTWGQTNFSLWYVELTGVTEPSVVRGAAQKLKEFQQESALRLCLKHLRQNDYQEAFCSLKKQAHLDLEHPLLTKLHTELVDKGDYTSAELIFSQAVTDGLLDSHIDDQPSQAVWQLINDQSCDINSWPCARGGHQLCLDVESQLIYLFGGWDGSQELADLWVYNIRRKQWKCLCRDTSEQGGPSPRSCHKMCIDVQNQILYVIGRYIDQETRTSLFTFAVPGDFYSYSISTGIWEELSTDTHSNSGPRLIYDHQICFNSLNQTIYVYGGRVITSCLQEGIRDDPIFSGLYGYKCMEKEWVCLRPDYCRKEAESYPDTMKPRMAHTMVLDVESQNLYILGGQREKQSLCDLWQYNISSDTTLLLADGSTSHIPAAGYTVRATFEPTNSELYLHMGISRRENISNNRDNNSNSLWVYSLNTKKWSRITSLSPSPCPRFAHQLIYDSVNHTHYLFGGNPGSGTSSLVRLNDFWTMKIQRQTREKLLQKCIYMIRKKRYHELTQLEPAEALRYLKTTLAECVNHSNIEQSQEFRVLTSQLFTEVEHLPSVRELRSQLFAQLSSLFPEEVSQPRSDLINFIDY